MVGGKEMLPVDLGFNEKYYSKFSAIVCVDCILLFRCFIQSLKNQFYSGGQWRGKYGATVFGTPFYVDVSVEPLKPGNYSTMFERYCAQLRRKPALPF